VKQSTDHFVGDGYFFLVDADRVLVDDIWGQIVPMQSMDPHLIQPTM
jgi:hypothetical protein